MVREANIANHVGGIHSVHNQESIGIEHVNPYTPSARMTPTERQYEASARLVQWLCHRYNIPIMHELTPRGRGIKGHIEVSPNSRHVNCPNPAWDWNLYIGLVNNPHPLDVLLEPVLLR